MSTNATIYKTGAKKTPEGIFMSSSIGKAGISLYHWILGKEYWEAGRAFKIARDIHNGKRKDGNPEFSHQIWIANFVRTLPIPPEDMERAIVIALLHDTIEDYPHLKKEIKNSVSKRAVKDSLNMSKIRDGARLDEDEYMNNLLKDPLTAIVKGVDRAHNLYSMKNGFKIEKQKEQIAETRQYHLPMLKEARKIYINYHLCFESIKMLINMQIMFLEDLHASLENHENLENTAKS